MDPAPAGVIPMYAYKHFDYLIPNETEAEALVGHSVGTNEEVINAARIKKALRNYYAMLRSAADQGDLAAAGKLIELDHLEKQRQLQAQERH